VEPGGLDRAGGLSTDLSGGPFPLGSPEQYAMAKARLFPQEGGAAILEIDVPESIAELGIDAGGAIRFIPGFGLEELVNAWPSLSKKMIVL
jgi:hypothetical protein